MNFFFTVEIIESYLQINSQQTIEELSAQHITSCTPNELQCGGNGNFFSDFFLSKQRSKYLRKRTFSKIFFPLGGCQGSIPQLGFTYTQLFGLVSEADYPYTSGNVSI